jgi:hypothetical protein
MFSSDFPQASFSATPFGVAAAHHSSAVDNREAQPIFHALPIPVQNSSIVPPASFPLPTAPSYPLHRSNDTSNYSHTIQASSVSLPKAQREPDEPKSSTSSTIPKAKRPGIYDVFVPAKMATGPGSALDIIPSGVNSAGIEQPKVSFADISPFIHLCSGAFSGI